MIVVPVGVALAGLSLAAYYVKRGGRARARRRANKRAAPKNGPLVAHLNVAGPSDDTVTIQKRMHPGRENPAAKPLSARKSDLAQRWVEWLKLSGRARMPRDMREEFRAIFWEENEQNAAEGRPLRLPLNPSDTFMRDDGSGLCELCPFDAA